MMTHDRNSGLFRQTGPAAISPYDSRVIAAKGLYRPNGQAIQNCLPACQGMTNGNTKTLIILVFLKRF
jgi:hypothetical protein